jgi:hypothetical protein
MRGGRSLAALALAVALCGCDETTTNIYDRGDAACEDPMHGVTDERMGQTHTFLVGPGNLNRDWVQFLTNEYTDSARAWTVTLTGPSVALQPDAALPAIQLLALIEWGKDTYARAVVDYSGGQVVGVSGKVVRISAHIGGWAGWPANGSVTVGAILAEGASPRNTLPRRTVARYFGLNPGDPADLDFLTGDPSLWLPQAGKPDASSIITFARRLRIVTSNPNNAQLRVEFRDLGNNNVGWSNTLAYPSQWIDIPGHAVAVAISNVGGPNVTNYATEYELGL